MAVRMETYGKALLPGERWQEVITKLYPTAKSAQKKAGPRQTFVGLCEAGLVKGIAGSEQPKGNRNADYAREAVRLLREGQSLSTTQLWAAVAPADAQHDSQMDVVMALWKNGYLA